MAWSTPRNWTAGEVVTESMMDVHVRDNLQYLKDVLDGVVLQGVDLQFVDGSVGAPSISFISDTDTGIYRAAADYLVLTVGGTAALQIYKSGATRQLIVGGGSLANPGIAFETDLSTGLRWVSAGVMTMVSVGLDVVSIGNSAGTRQLGLFGTAPIAKIAVTGSRGGNAALASLLSALSGYGLITDSSSA